MYVQSNRQSDFRLRRTFWRPVEFKPYSERKQMTFGNIYVYVVVGKIEINFLGKNLLQRYVLMCRAVR